MAWVAQVEMLDKDEFARFRRELESDPTAGPVSHGTRALMGVFGAAGGAPPSTYAPTKGE